MFVCLFVFLFLQMQPKLPFKKNMSLLCGAFSALADGLRLLEPEPDRQLPPVPQPRRGGRTSLPRQQAQQSILRSLCVPPGPLMPPWREQPLHRGQFVLHQEWTVCLFAARMILLPEKKKSHRWETDRSKARAMGLLDLTSCGLIGDSVAKRAYMVC